MIRNQQIGRSFGLSGASVEGQRVEVFGSGGAVAVSNNTPDRAVISDASGVHAALPLYFFLERYMQAYADEMKAFVECIQQGRPPLNDGEHALRNLKLVLAAYEAARTGKIVEV